jgi:hypothetical protein
MLSGRRSVCNMMIWNAASYCAVVVRDTVIVASHLTLVYKPGLERPLRGGAAFCEESGDGGWVNCRSLQRRAGARSYPRAGIRPEPFGAGAPATVVSDRGADWGRGGRYNRRRDRRDGSRGQANGER